MILTGIMRQSTQRRPVLEGLKGECAIQVSEDVIQCIELKFLVRLYGGKHGSDLDDLRYKIFSRKKELPKIKSLPPTKNAAVHHIKRARLQVLMWCAAGSDCPQKPEDACKYGWEKQGQELHPVLGTSSAAPLSVLKSVVCS